MHQWSAVGGGKISKANQTAIKVQHWRSVNRRAIDVNTRRKKKYSRREKTTKSDDDLPQETSAKTTIGTTANRLPVSVRTRQAKKSWTAMPIIPLVPVHIPSSTRIKM